MKPQKIWRCRLLAGVGALGLVACANPSTEAGSTGGAIAPAASTTDAVSDEPSPSQPSAALPPRDGALCNLVQNGSGPVGQVNVVAEEVVSGLDVPWGIVFISPDDMLVTERGGQIRRVQNGQLLPQPVATLAVTASGEGGLLDIEAHPDFAENRLFYLYYTADEAGVPVNRVERWWLSEDGSSAAPDQMILDNIPVARFHNGGRLRFGPDGMLYIGTGDARSPDLSQDVNSLAGKILRLTPDGDIPDDNPFPGLSTYILGIRNTQGFDWANESVMWVTDHGPSGELGRSGHDKVSVATTGDNLGWPTLHACESAAGLVSPALTWRQAVPPGGAAVYTGDAIPEWRGSLLVGGLRAEHLHRVVFDPEAPYQLQQHEVYFSSESGNSLGRIREVTMGPDHELYVTTSNCDGRGNCPTGGDRIYRITR